MLIFTLIIPILMPLVFLLLCFLISNYHLCDFLIYYVPVYLNNGTPSYIIASVDLLISSVVAIYLTAIIVEETSQLIGYIEK